MNNKESVAVLENNCLLLRDFLKKTEEIQPHHSQCNIVGKFVPFLLIDKFQNGDSPGGASAAP
jgi:hypothetical protein